MSEVECDSAMSSNTEAEWTCELCWAVNPSTVTECSCSPENISPIVSKPAPYVAPSTFSFLAPSETPSIKIAMQRIERLYNELVHAVDVYNTLVGTPSDHMLPPSEPKPRAQKRKVPDLVKESPAVVEVAPISIVETPQSSQKAVKRKRPASVSTPTTSASVLVGESSPVEPATVVTSRGGRRVSVSSRLKD